MISQAGISIFVFGNKMIGRDVLMAEGMESEFKICVEQHNLVVPIG